MGVIFGLHGQTVVEHVSDRGHVNTTGSHISCYQHLNLTVTQRHQTAVTQTLAQRAVQSSSREASFLQVGRQAIALHLGGCKHNGLVDGLVTQPVVQHLALVLGIVSPEQHLLDAGMLFLGRIDRDLLHARAVVVHHTHGQLLHARRKRSTEHHGLLALRSHLIDFSQIIREAQIQHAVGFVHYQELNLVQLDLHGALQIQQAARCCHDQVSVLQLGNLQLVRNTTHHIGNTQTTAVLDQLDGVMRNLLSQLTCRAQNQGTGYGSLEIAGIGRILALGTLRQGLTLGSSFSTLAIKLSLDFGLSLSTLLKNRVQHWQQESSRLAGTGLARDHQVDKTIGVRAFAHGQRNGLELHSGWLGVAQICNSLHQLRRQAQLNKTVRLYFNSLLLDFSSGVNRFDRFSSCLSSNIQSGSVQSSIRSGQLALLIQRVVHVFSREKRPMKAGNAFLTVMETSTVKRYQRRA